MEAFGSFWNSGARGKAITLSVVSMVIICSCCVMFFMLRDISPISLLIVFQEQLIKFGNQDSTSIANTILAGILVGVITDLAIAITKWAFSLVRQALSPHRVERSDFPFRPVEAQRILEEISSFPGIETPYICREDSAEALMLKDLTEYPCILLVGRMGIGKTREAAELISRMDIPFGQVVVLKPEKTLLGTSYEWRTDVPLRERHIVLLLDNLNDFDLYDEDTDEAFQLASNPLGFGRVLTRLIGEFCKRCDDFRLIATLRLESEEWRMIENRVDLEPWNKFHIHILSPHTSTEAVGYIGSHIARLENIQFTPEAIQHLAIRFDGSFASIRDFLRLKETLVKNDSVDVVIGKDEVAEFAGMHPKDWETRVYEQIIRPNVAGRAIFEALDVIAKSHIMPHEDIVMGLAARIVGKRFVWFRERQCRHAFRDLGLSTWISKRDSILRSPDAYIEGRGNLEERLDDLSHTLLRLSKGHTLSPQLHDSLLTFARLMNTSYVRHDLSARLSKRVTEIEPSNTRAWIILGVAYSKLDQDAEALKARQRVVQLMPNNGFAWSYLASSLLELERYDEAQRAIERAIRLEAHDAFIACTQGKIALKRNDVKQAIRVFRQATILKPSLAVAWSGLAQGYFQKQQFREAIRHFHRAIDLGIMDPAAWSGLGMALKKMKRYSIAQKAFRCAIDLGPKHPLPWSHLGEILLEQKKYGESREAYQQAVDLDANNPLSWGGLGKTLNRLGHFKEAIQPHQRAITLGGDYFSNLFGLGIAFYGAGRLEKAAEAFQELYNRTRSYLAKKYIENIRDRLIVLDTEHLVHELLDADLNHDEVHRAVKLADTGDHYAAQVICDRLASIDTGDWVIWSGLCSAYRKIGESDRAIKAGIRATEVEPNAKSAWYTLGRAYEEAGDLDTAERIFEKTLTLDSTHQKAKSALEKVRYLLAKELKG